MPQFSLSSLCEVVRAISQGGASETAAGNVQ